MMGSTLRSQGSGSLVAPCERPCGVGAWRASSGPRFRCSERPQNCSGHLYQDTSIYPDTMTWAPAPRDVWLKVPVIGCSDWTRAEGNFFGKSTVGMYDTVLRC
ncbi:hypothetical protein GW7_21720 [Heterocephalus glaber]|uniref:Uncharacterized protein n=1 Tax=Heterocephalus glaber TaxID=10181 RepID=G5BRM3_HETGA|nr:hypothetical protein GW7_21720 [Heterocephalus glaber]